MDAERALDELARGGLDAPARTAHELVEGAWPVLNRRVAIFQRALGVQSGLWDDCAQETLLRVWRARSSYRGKSRDQLFAWLFRICEREHLRLVERRQRTETKELEEGAASDSLDASSGAGDAGRPAEMDDERRALDQCIAELEAASRQALELLYADSGASEREVAVVIGVSKSQVNVLRHRALTAVANCLRKKGVEG